MLFAFAIFWSSNGQIFSECRGGDHRDTPAYRIGRIRRGVVNNERILLLQISVKPARFNRSDMTALARQLNSDFRKEKNLNVAICDTFEAAKDTSLIYGLLTHQTHPVLRGFYDLNRVSGKEAISFSTQRGEPLDEVTINFNFK